MVDVITYMVFHWNWNSEKTTHHGCDVMISCAFMHPIDSTNNHAHTQHVPVVSLRRKHVPTTVFTQRLPTATLGTASQGVVMELHA